MIDAVFFPNPVQVGTTQPARQPDRTGSSQPRTPFADVLREKLPGQGLAFSQHAQERIAARGIALSAHDLQELEGAVESVARKGGRESLVLMGDAAFVVSVRNRTVVTALDRQNLQGNVFTNIDSAVLVK